MAEVERQVREVMAEVLEVDARRIGEEFARGDAPSWDSLNHLRLVAAIEEAFGVRFTMREVGEMESYAAIRRLLAARIASA
ncbi:MAG TPA: acyl carrier protein [Thermoanaerobaculia bacterium]|nr:acyl carrier protein [Thermoanaerobaculia bacterium]